MHVKSTVNIKIAKKNAINYEKTIKCLLAFRTALVSSEMTNYIKIYILLIIIRKKTKTSQSHLNSIPLN